MNDIERERKSTTADTTGAAARPAAPPTTPPEPERSGAGREVPIARADSAEKPAPLFSSEEAEKLRADWDSLQIGFVDEPRQSVEQADELVARVMKRLAEVFARERASLEGQWARGDEVSTEDLRVALRRYRSFFGRLLSF